VGLQQRNPTSDVAFSGTWSGTPGSRYTLVDDYPDAGNPITDGLTHGTTAGQGLFGFNAFSLPSDATNIVVRVNYYDFKNGAQACNIRVRIRCNDTTGRDAPSGSHNPNNGNGAITQRFQDYTTNPKTGVAWTVNDINGVGSNAISAFGWISTDANPTITLSSINLQVLYDSASEDAAVSTDVVYPNIYPGGIIRSGRRWPYTAGVRDMLPQAVVAQQNIAWFQQQPSPRFPSRFSAAHLQLYTKVSFRVEITPAMWRGIYPDRIAGRQGNYSGSIETFTQALLDSTPQPGDEGSPPWGQDQSVIGAYRRWQYQSFFGPNLIIEDEDAGPDVSGQYQAPTSGVIQSGKRFLYQPGVRVIVAPEQPPTVVPDINTWLGSYADFVIRSFQHPAYSPHHSLANLDPLGSAIEYWFQPLSEPVRNDRIIHPAYYDKASVRVDFRLEITPAMWTGYRPDVLYKRISARPWLPTGPIFPPTVDFKLAWIGQYPLWIDRRKPTHNVAPTWFGPDVPRPNIQFLYWLAHYPNFIERLRAQPELWPSYFGPEATLPETADDIDFFTWFIENIDFARGLTPSHYLQPASFWNPIEGLPDPSGHIVWYKRRRRP
jgi:hypothetical protein